VGLVLLSPYFAAPTAPAWLRVVGAEVQAACRDPGTQWMVVVCLASYLAVFLFLERRLFQPQMSTEGPGLPVVTHTSPRPSPLPAGAERVKSFALFRGHLGNPNVWLVGCLFLGLLRYAVDYETAARSMLPLVLVAGVVFGKGVALWAAWPPRLKTKIQSLKLEEAASRHLTPALSPFEAERVSEPSSILHLRSSSRQLTVLAIFTFLLAAAALWQPELGMEFQYRGLRRWSGAWENPNLYGLLMGVGVVLAVGQIVLGLKSKSQKNTAHSQSPHPQPLSQPLGEGGVGLSPDEAERENQHPTFNFRHSTRNAAHWLWLALLIAAAGLCGFGLLKSFSRGAWLGTAIGLGFLLWSCIRSNAHLIPALDSGHLIRPSATFSPSDAEKGARGGEGGSFSCSSWGSWFRSNWLPASVILASVLMLAFWQFRHTENPVVRRAFSVGNPNDFSWRNRVAAWQGAGRMMLDNPLLGFGWGKAEQVYREQYRAARLEDSAAIQMNDYLMLGISCGVPALVCFVGYVFFASRGPRVEGRETGGVRHLTRSLSPCEAERESELSTINLQPSTAAAAGAIVLLVGFWFDGGLFRLPTATVFWVLFELARISPVQDPERRSPTRRESYDTSQHAGSGDRRSRRPAPRFEARSLISEDALPALAPSEGERVAARPGEGMVNKRSRSTLALRCLAGLLALLAGGLTALHLVTPQLAITERTLAITRNHLLTPKARADFDYLAAQAGWSGQPVRTLRQHAELANYNRDLVGWKLDDELYREFVLNPFIDSASGAELHWRRELWESFYPRIRRETSLPAAAEIVGRYLGERVKISTGNRTPGGVVSIWQSQTTDARGFETIYVAALRSVGIPARLSPSGKAEFWNGAEWLPAPGPGR
jgi:hypothetical protein